MKQRVKLAQALVHDPDLLLLDEPTNGLDPDGREEMLSLIHDVSQRRQMSLILCSHLLRDVERVCESVIVFNQGQVAARGPIAELTGTRRSVFDLRLKGDPAAFLTDLKDQGCEWRESDDGYRLFLADGLGYNVHGCKCPRPRAVGARMVPDLVQSVGLQRGAERRRHSAAQRSFDGAVNQGVFKENRNPFDGQPRVTRNCGCAILDGSHVSAQRGPLRLLGHPSVDVKGVIRLQHHRAVVQNRTAVPWPRAKIGARYHGLAVRTVDARLFCGQDQICGEEVFVFEALSRQEHSFQRGY
jgi:hypothetical protein